MRDLPASSFPTVSRFLLLLRRVHQAKQLDDVIFGLLNDQKFVHDPAYRREQLVLLRQKIETAEFDPELREQVLEKVAREYAGKGLFVRSSSNSKTCRTSAARVCTRPCRTCVASSS
jgi:hypothetical protein